jgi:hypothetical protein
LGAAAGITGRPRVASVAVRELCSQTRKLVVGDETAVGAPRAWVKIELDALSLREIKILNADSSAITKVKYRLVCIAGDYDRRRWRDNWTSNRESIRTRDREGPSHLIGALCERHGILTTTAATRSCGLACTRGNGTCGCMRGACTVGCTKDQAEQKQETLQVRLGCVCNYRNANRAEAGLDSGGLRP